MKTFYALLLVMGIALSFIPKGHTQKQYADKFESQLEAGGKLLLSGYHFTFERVDKKTFIYKQYYPDTRQMTHRITYPDKQRSIPHGPYTEWWDNGSLRYQGQFDRGEHTGEWIESHSRGTYAKGKYVKGKKDGMWVVKDQEERTTYQVGYINGLIEGEWIYFDTLGQVKRKDMYENGVFVETIFNVEVTDSLATDNEVVKPEEMPRFHGCESVEDAEAKKQCASKKMLEYLYRNIKYPAKARREDVQGTAIVGFIVNKEGMVEEIKVLRGLCAEIKKEVEELVQAMPQWVPGIYRGEPARVYFYLPIKFKLE